LEDPEDNGIRYAYVDMTGRLGLQVIPQAAETLMVSYYAYPAAVVDDTTTWQMPDDFQDACTRIAAGKVLMKVQTEWAHRTRQQLYEEGWADVERLKNASLQKREAGDAK